MALCGVMLKKGSRGPMVKELQEGLNILGYNPGPPDGIFGKITEQCTKAFQRDHRLPVDGLFGRETMAKFNAALGQVPNEPNLGDRPLSPGASGPDVAALQEHLAEVGFSPGSFDGAYGPQTVRAVRNFQRDNGLTVDGITGPQTIAALSFKLIDQLI